MERAKKHLELSKDESQRLSKLVVNSYRPFVEMSFFDDFVLRGIRVDRVQPGLIICSFKVPPRLIDRNDKLCSGVIAHLVDQVGGAAIYLAGVRLGLSVTMSISYLSDAQVDDDLEVTSRLLGCKDSCYGASVLIKNKGTGKIVAEGRHTMFSKM